MDKQNHIINYKNIRIAIGLQIISSLILIIGLVMIGKLNGKGKGTHFTHFGPATKDVEINIFGLDIDTWTKWSILIGFLIFTELINTYAAKIYNNWYKNIVADPKSNNIGMKEDEAMIIINIWDITTWFSKMFKWMILILTKQLQFLLPQFLAYLFISNIINHNYVYKKRFTNHFINKNLFP